MLKGKSFVSVIELTANLSNREGACPATSIRGWGGDSVSCSSRPAVESGPRRAGGTAPVTQCNPYISTTTPALGIRTCPFSAEHFAFLSVGRRMMTPEEERIS